MNYSLYKYTKSLYMFSLNSQYNRWGNDLMELIKTFRDGNDEIENHIKIENGIYTHRQIEKIDGKVFMRIKSRRLVEVIDR